MDTEKIQQDLQKRFAAPLPPYYQRRIIFWYDQDREFADKLGELQLADVKILQLTGSNSFAAKLQLHQDSTSNYLVYCPLSYAAPEDDWLLDVKLYSEDFRADIISIWLHELGLPEQEPLRELMKTYKKYFNAKDRREKFAAFCPGITTPAQMMLALQAVLSGSRTAEAGPIIKAVLCQVLDTESNAAYSKMRAWGVDGAFRSLVAKVLGYSEGDDLSLLHLAEQLVVGALAKAVGEDNLPQLKQYYEHINQGFAYDLLSQWQQSKEIAALELLLQKVKDELDLQEALRTVPTEALLNVQLLPQVDEILLERQLEAISQNIFDLEAIGKMLEVRRTCTWYAAYEYYYQALAAMRDMKSFAQNHGAGFHLAQAEEIWQAYTTDYYLMDSAYRKFHLAFSMLKQYSQPTLDELLKTCAENMDNLYHNWFLANLCQNWVNAAAAPLQAHGRISGIPQQNDFYEKYVAGAGKRTFVIISDALRYEVAAELAEQLQREFASKVELGACQGIFPTATPYGMAALLPHKQLTLERSGASLLVKADGLKTDAPNRAKVLRQANPDSITLSADVIIKAKREERKEWVKGMQVIYIYHDVIDNGGHEGNPETSQLCEKAMSELKNLVRIMINDLTAAHIIITADHGFLYNYRELQESDKIGAKEYRDHIVELGRRHVILEPSVTPDFLLPVQLFDGTTELRGFTPRETIRLKSGGKGTKFVHGGISLQEMVVPVLDMSYYRSDNKTLLKNKDKYAIAPVSIGCSFISHTISNQTFSLTFYQKEAVGANRGPATYKLYFTDMQGREICQPVKLIADKTSPNEQERIFKCHFQLYSRPYKSSETYFLVIEPQDGSAVQRVEFAINLAYSF